MIYSRIITYNDDFSDIIKQLNLSKKADFAFYDLVYLNKNGASITEDQLKIRVYQINEWNSKNVLVIRKTAPVINGVKEDKVLLKKEFDTEEEAIDFVNKNLSTDYEYKFKLQKDGIQYGNEKLDIWVEHIEGIGTSVEFGSEDPEVIEEAIALFEVKERLNESVPEYFYNTLTKKRKIQ